MSKWRGQPTGFAVVFAAALMLALSAAPAFAANIYGKAYRNGETDHAGIAVKLLESRDVPALGGAAAVMIAMVLGAALLLRRRQWLETPITAAMMLFAVTIVGAQVVQETQTSS
ncbi:MAG: hypothetical protein HYV63_03425 [Candidatus Schekmanbacteria bacterium]|nr:hypothetical protein [Candidatus Schekmanbacteria bacterium]